MRRCWRGSDEEGGGAIVSIINGGAEEVVERSYFCMWCSFRGC